MKLKANIELTGPVLEAWEKYKVDHAFLNPSDDMLVTALLQEGLKQYRLKRNAIIRGMASAAQRQGATEK